MTNYGIELPTQLQTSLRAAYAKYRRSTTQRDKSADQAAQKLAQLLRAARAARISWEQIRAILNITNDAQLRPLIQRWETTSPPKLSEDQITAQLPTAHRKYVATSEAHRKYREETAARLAYLVAAGREQHWPWPLLAAPCVKAGANDENLSGERLRQIVHRWTLPEHRPHTLPTFPDYRELVEKERRQLHPQKQRKPKGQITEAEAARLLKLSPLARENRGTLNLKDKKRKAAEDFSKLIIKLRERNVSWEDISLATGGPGKRARAKDEPKVGHTIVGLRMRAARHGMGSVPPSISAYRRVKHPHGKKTSRGVRNEHQSAPKDASKSAEEHAVAS